MRQGLVTLILAMLVVVLPLLMGHRTPQTLTLSGLVLVLGALLSTSIGLLGRADSTLPAPDRSWWLFAWVLTVVIMLQAAPSVMLAQWLGPYPEVVWNQSESLPAQWSPNPAATLRGWSTFIALFFIAWLVGTLPTRMRDWLWLTIVGCALLQALYGLVSHATGSDTIFGIWSRNNAGVVHGSFSNRNLFAAYLALIWPLSVAIWWRRSISLLKSMPFELRVAASLISGAIIGAALLGSASRLGSTAGLAGMLIGLGLWMRYRIQQTRPVPVWPMVLIASAVLIAATWYGLTPLAERLAVTSIEEGRIDIYARIIAELPAQWWLTGVGLGGFEAVFKQIQPGHINAWYDYAHNDLLQWLLEMGLIGAGLLIAVLTGIWRNASLNSERIPLYAGLTALALVGLGDFSWHIPGTQIVLAIYLGIVLQPDRSLSTPFVQQKSKDMLAVAASTQQSSSGNWLSIRQGGTNYGNRN